MTTAEIDQIIDGKYKIVRLLGTGGMGAVYEGENIRIRRRVAIKMLHGAVSSQAESVTRFEREAQAAGRIGSEHICEVLDLGVLADGTRYMVMEYLEGETLSGRIKRLGRLTTTQSIALISQALEGLGAAHTAGIVHRDLKPDNVWIVPQRGGTKDFVKILDFGVSKFSQGGGEEMNMTRAGAVVGTPYYMSPEQARGMSAVDQRTDIYAMGVVLYQATTGQVPYQAETFNELLFKIVLEVAPPPQTYVPDIDPEFAGIIQRAMAREPTHRFQSAAEFRDALLAYQTGRAGGGRPSLPGLAGTQLLDGPSFVMQAPQAQMAPWGNASTSGAQAAMPGGQPHPGMVSGQWGPQAPPGQPGPNATSNSWGNASGAVAVKPKSNTGIMIGIAGAVVVLAGIGIAAVMMLGHQGSSNASASDSSSSAPAAESAAPTPAASASAPAATASASAAEAAPTPAASSAPAATEPDLDTPAPAAAAAAPKGGGGRPGKGGGGRPAGGGKPAAAPAAPAAKPASKPASNPGDLGY